MSWHTWAWLAWGAVFLVLELPPVVAGDVPATLSGTVWRWFRIRGVSEKSKARPWVWWARAGLVLFMAWLFVHISFGWLG